jgi:hypothetical protein
VSIVGQFLTHDIIKQVIMVDWSWFWHILEVNYSLVIEGCFFIFCGVCIGDVVGDWILSYIDLW